MRAVTVFSFGDREMSKSPVARWPGVVAVSLVLLLAVFLFETALHSAHHLADPDEQGAPPDCGFASASGHLTVADPGPIALEPVVIPHHEAPILFEAVAKHARPFSPTRDRAPPAVPSV